MILETKRHESEVNLLTERIKKLQSELERSYGDKSSNSSKIHELDKLVNQLLAVNESLVTQLSGKIGHRPSSVSTQKSKRVNVPRVANVTTAALEAAKTKKFPSERLVPVKTEEIDELVKLHKMYASMAQSLIADVPISEPKKTSKTRATRISRKKSLASTAKDIPRQPFTSEAVLGKDLRNNQSTPIYIPGTISVDANASYLSRSKSVGHLSRARGNRDTDLNDVISSLEEEFEALNLQYRRLLGTVQRSDVAADSSRAEELINVIQKLHKKGEQLRALKSPIKA